MTLFRPPCAMSERHPAPLVRPGSRPCRYVDDSGSDLPLRARQNLLNPPGEMLRRCREFVVEEPVLQLLVESRRLPARRSGER